MLELNVKVEDDLGSQEEGAVRMESHSLSSN